MNCFMQGIDWRRFAHGRRRRRSGADDAALGQPRGGGAGRCARRSADQPQTRGSRAGRPCAADRAACWLTASDCHRCAPVTANLCSYASVCELSAFANLHMHSVPVASPNHRGLSADRRPVACARLACGAGAHAAMELRLRALRGPVSSIKAPCMAAPKPRCAKMLTLPTST